MGLFSGISKAVGGVLGPLATTASGFIPGLSPISEGLNSLGAYASAQDAYRATREGAEQANEWAKAAAEQQYGYQRESYKNRYQWQMADMRKAGLNPLLAYQQGAGGALAGSTYTPQNIEAGALPAVNSAAANAKMATERKMMRSTVNRINQDVKTGKAQETNIEHDTNLKVQQTRESWQRQGQLMELQAKIRAEANIARQNLQSAKAAASAARHDEAFWKTDLGKLLRQVNLAGQAVNPFANSAKTVKGITR